MCADKKEIKKKLDKIEGEFDRNYKERQRLEDRQEKLVKKLEKTK